MNTKGMKNTTGSMGVCLAFLVPSCRLWAPMRRRPPTRIALWSSPSCSRLRAATAVRRGPHPGAPVEGAANRRRLRGGDERARHLLGPSGVERPLRFQRFTERQTMYGDRLRLAGVYTPQLVIDARSNWSAATPPSSSARLPTPQPGRSRGSSLKPPSPPTAPSPERYQGPDSKPARRKERSCCGPSLKTISSSTSSAVRTPIARCATPGSADAGRQEDRSRDRIGSQRRDSAAARMETGAPSTGGVRAVHENQARAQRRLDPRTCRTLKSRLSASAFGFRLVRLSGL